MLTLGSRFKARLQVRQNVFSARFLWIFVVSSCFFLVFQEAEIHSAGLRPSVSMCDLHCLHRQAATATPPFRIPFPRPHPCHSQLHPQRIPFRGHDHYWPQPPLQHRPPAAAGPRCRGRSLLPSAATCRLGAPAEVADAEGPVSCMVRWFFPIRNDAKAMEKSLLVWPTGLGSTGKPALTSHSN